MAKLRVVNPQANTIISPVSMAPRVADLAGKTIGLYWNMKAGGDLALEHTANLLGQRFPGTNFKHYVGTVGAMLCHVTGDDADRIAAECDAVVGTTSD
ncbi:MAG: hypothetical protein ACE5JL_18735 [Dehalococcoidia bacterium]